MAAPLTQQAVANVPPETAAATSSATGLAAPHQPPSPNSPLALTKISTM